jgi:hypothetical protein
MHNSFVPKEVLNKIMDVQDTSIGQPAVSPSSAHVRDEASDAAAAAILASQMGQQCGVPNSAASSPPWLHGRGGSL